MLIYSKKYILMIQSNYINYINSCNKIQIKYILVMVILINYPQLMNYVIIIK